MSDARILAELFTATHLQQLAWYGESEPLSASIPVITAKTETRASSRVRELLEAAFGILTREYPVEYIFKACFLKRRLFGVHSPATTALYMEFPVGNARADMLLVNGSATAIEVKSRFDDPTRLGKQLEAYFQCFSRVAVLVEERDAAAYIDALPNYVGVYALTRRYSIGIRRSATSEDSRLDHVSMFQALRKGEYHRIVAEQGVDLERIDPADQFQVALECYSQLPIEVAHKRLVSALRARQTTRRIADLCNALPESLHVGAFSFRFRKKDWASLLNVLDKPLILG